MKNPLNRRFFRELKGDLGKYLAIFLFLVIFAGAMSGFFCASNSVMKLYEDSHEELNLEDGHISFNMLPDDEVLETLEKDNALKFTPMNYKEETIKETENTVRIYADRDKVNLVSLYDGDMPEGTDEIALDRMYADNNDLKIGDTITINNQKLKISGTIALPDYSALYENNNDMMFDSVNFGVAIMSKEGYEAFESVHETINYAWKYDAAPVDDSEANSRFEDLTDSLEDVLEDYDEELVKKQMEELANDPQALAEFEVDENTLLSVDNCLPEYLNQAINFVGTDGSSDRVSAQLMTYIIMAIIAFLFAVTVSNTISKEAYVIGTLRASGYSRGELVRHYMVLPIIVTILGCAVGNVLGYTVIVNMIKNVYYGSYSLPVFKAYFNADAFVQTTVVPLVLTVVINLILLVTKMRLKPLKFLRGELKKSKKKSSLKLSAKLPFFARFRLRILFQNIPSYIVLVVGIIMAGILSVFGFMFLPLIEDYGNLVQETKICEYQYVLMNQVETDNDQAEKFCMTSLETNYKDYLADDVSVYGIEDDSSYINADIPEGEVLISNAAAEKFKLKAGDEFSIKDKYSDTTYTFKIAGEYTYDAAIAVFMTRDDYLETFDKDDDYFTGYFSNETLTDIDDDDVATIIDSESLLKVVNQMNASFGSFMVVFQIMGAGIFILLMFILTKQIIEKNMKAISMTKILGFTNGEVGRLYLIITSIVVVAGLLVSIPLIDVALRYIMSSYMYKEMSGYLPYIVSSECYIKTVAMGIICYVIVALLMMLKIRKIPKGEILKNQNL